tara:strand:- start:342 stop:1055 length:714 start_codon:yes stop_codon:yes gene_type:complete
MDFPNVSIITPTYNRNHFLPIMIKNLQSQEYPQDKLEWVIDDDGSDKMIKCKEDYIELQKLIYPIKLSYNYYTVKRSIGVKRNNLVKKSKYNIIASMDSDDFYNKEYLSYSVGMLLYNKFGLVGSNQMLFLYPHHDFKVTGIQCGEKRQIHEACMVFTKKHFHAMTGFQSKGVGEGCKMVDFMNPKTIGLTDVNKQMICICHEDNTVNKDRFLTSSLVTGDLGDGLKNILMKILNIN